MVTTRGGARQTHRAADVFVSIGERCRDTGRCRPPRALDGRSTAGRGLASASAAGEARSGCAGDGAAGTRTRQLCATDPSTTCATLGRIGPLLSISAARNRLPLPVGAARPTSVRSQPVRTSCSSVAMWEAMDSAHRGGKRIADQAFLPAGMADEDEVVAEALEPGGFTHGERAVQPVVEEPAAARVVEVGGDRAREPFAVQPRVGLRVIAAAVGRLDRRTAPFLHLAQPLDQILAVIPRLMVGHHVLARRRATRAYPDRGARASSSRSPIASPTVTNRARDPTCLG